MRLATFCVLSDRSCKCNSILLLSFPRRWTKCWVLFYTKNDSTPEFLVIESFCFFDKRLYSLISLYGNIENQALPWNDIVYVIFIYYIYCLSIHFILRKCISFIHSDGQLYDYLRIIFYEKLLKLFTNSFSFDKLNYYYEIRRELDQRFYSTHNIVIKDSTYRRQWGCCVTQYKALRMSRHAVVNRNDVWIPSWIPMVS